jgi:hypothetical protein
MKFELLLNTISNFENLSNYKAEAWTILWPPTLFQGSIVATYATAHMQGVIDAKSRDVIQETAVRFKTLQLPYMTFP